MQCTRLPLPEPVEAIVAGSPKRTTATVAQTDAGIEEVPSPPHRCDADMFVVLFIGNRSVEQAAAHTSMICKCAM